MADNGNKRRVYSGIVHDFMMFRHQYNLTQEDCARIFRVRQPDVCKYESGKVFPPARVIGRMMEIMQNYTTCAE